LADLKEIVMSASEIDEWRNNYDWDEAFICANRDQRTGVLDVETSEITIPNVASVLLMQEGENDEESWLMAGICKDGRYFFLSAWCDYTGRG
jgi:hypothetical protein